MLGGVIEFEGSVTLHHIEGWEISVIKILYCIFETISQKVV